MPDTPLQHADYARHPLTRRRRTWLVVLGLLALTALTTVVFAVSQARKQGLSWTTTGYTVVSDSRVDVSFHVAKRTDDVAVCRVVAQDRSTEVVGEARVEVPAGRRETTAEVTLETTTRAILGRVDACEVAP